jgi:phosphatidylglycerol:prolipoprotein diacylglycerol transferase
MWQTLFTIPEQIAGIDVFGFGWVLAIWSLGSLAVVGYSWWKHGWTADTRSRLSAAVVVALIVAFVLPGLMDPRLGGLAIRGYGAMLLLAVVSGVGLSLYRAYRVGLDMDLMMSLATWFFIAGIIGARAFYVIEYWPNFQRPTAAQTLFAILNLTQGGLVVYGSLLAGGAALLIFIYKHHLPGLALSDLVGPGVVLGVGLGRLGCFMNGCCYGGVTDLPWAVQFPPESPAFVDQVENGTIYLHGLMLRGSGADPAVIERVEPGSEAEKHGLAAGQRVVSVGGASVDSVEQAQLALLQTFGTGRQVAIGVADDPEVKRWTLSGPPPRTRPVHPTQLYSVIDALLLCALVLLFEPYKRRDGELSAIVLTIHPISRFLLEAIRIDEGAVFGTGMSISQNISLAILAFGVGLWIYLLVTPPKAIAWQPRLAVAA